MSLGPHAQEEIDDLIEIEGFDYAMVYKTTFAGIKDKKFHKLRNAYLAAREALAEYVGATP